MSASKTSLCDDDGDNDVDDGDDGDDSDDGEFRILFVRWNSIGPGWVSKSDLIGESASVFEVAFHYSVFIHKWPRP